MDKNNIVFVTLQYPEAALIKSLLTAHDIEVIMYDESISRMHGLYAPAVGGIKLVVPDEEIERARDILKEYRSKEGQDPFCGYNSSLIVPDDLPNDDDINE